MFDSQQKKNAAKFASDLDDVFSRIAVRYDRLCDIFSLFIHRYWKRQMAKSATQCNGQVLFDAATGTGDIPLRIIKLCKSKNPGRESIKIIAGDISPTMMAIAEKKLSQTRGAVHLCIANAEYLNNIEGESIDIYTISFAMKIIDRSKVLVEAYRVLKPGGTFLCLEASHIPISILNQLYLRYMNFCMPLIGRIATGGDKSAYEYLLRGIKDFPNQEAFCEEIMKAGFENVTYKNFSFGIAALHSARKPS